MTPIITLEGVYKAFGPKQVLRGVDLVAGTGRSLVIIGGSGTGKSVAIKCILGLLKQDKGVIRWRGTDMARMGRADWRTFMESIGMLFQGGALFDSLKVWENIAFAPLQTRTITTAQAKELAITKLAAVGLNSEVAWLSPAELSGGMMKRVGLARAIATDPEIIFFDEPTTGLDPIMTDVINDLIASVVRTLGATAITITHDMSSVRKIADDVAMLHNGNIIWRGPADAMDECGNPYVEQFIHGRADGPIQMPVHRA